MVICAGGGKRGYVKYGCHAHKHNGMCGNKLMIRQDRLEEQLLSAIQQRILNPDTIDYAVKRCEEELRKRLTEMARQGSIPTVDSLKKDFEDRKRRQSKLVEALETNGDITSLTVRLREVEAEIKHIQEAIDAYRPVKLDVTISDIRDHVQKSLLQLQKLLANRGDFARARQALAQHIGKLILTPGMHDDRPVYRVTGRLGVKPDSEKGRMQLVARDGIEPPTPAFSGLRSTN
jgi:hypothetical protein